MINLTGGVPKGRVDLANPQGEKSYTGVLDTQYNHTKRIVLALTRDLARRVPATAATINAA
ncbi:hypothetical protein V5P93_002788 [Actinokineospora auranticolor]|uniref:Uncharacterized protein n=1 Tax=Actinokineospora auranticolor TaxID=155976 RepID=A0A2S6H0E0_9PSEU|nr:hypothetical protein [Actinokineospora auranticolor]PPK70928.1 hypothetical protein CLV40_101114 [Actinokineospora auranticolor]